MVFLLPKLFIFYYGFKEKLLKVNSNFSFINVNFCDIIHNEKAFAVMW